MVIVRALNLCKNEIIILSENVFSYKRNLEFSHNP